MDRLPAASFLKPTPYQTVMDIWKRYHTLTDKQQGNGYTHPQDVKDFMRVGETVDVMVNDLPSVLRWAVWKSWGITTQWHFKSANLMECITQAEEILVGKMKKNIATERYFR